MSACGKFFQQPENKITTSIRHLIYVDSIFPYHLVFMGYSSSKVSIFSFFFICDALYFMIKLGEKKYFPKKRACGTSSSFEMALQSFVFLYIYIFLLLMLLLYTFFFLLLTLLWFSFFSLFCLLVCLFGMYGNFVCRTSSQTITITWL